MSHTRAVVIPPPRSRASEPHVLATALLIAFLWFEVLWGAAQDTPLGDMSPVVAALLGTLSQLAFTAIEAAVACTAWGVQGVAVQWRVLAPRLLAVSSTEALAVAIATGHSALPRSLAVFLAGERAQPDTVAMGAARAFAAFGALTVVRLLASAGVQADAAHKPYRRGLAVVLALYLATRLAMWWTLALFQGRSFEP